MASVQAHRPPGNIFAGTYAKCAILTVDEIRDELGKEPFKDVKEASMPGVMTPNNGFIPLSSDAAQPLLAARQQSNTPPAGGSENDDEQPDPKQLAGKGKNNAAEKAAKITADKLTSVSLQVAQAYRRREHIEKKSIQMGGGAGQTNYYDWEWSPDVVRCLNSYKRVPVF